MASKRNTRQVDGILVLDKPLGMSSNGALQIVKRLVQSEKAGHTGSLDPLATGVLPLCFGEATKVSQILLEADKTYQAVIRLGITTASGDLDSEVLQLVSVPEFSTDELNQAIAKYTGTYLQTAPIYSALKQDGVPQYRLARAGKPVQAKQREVTIHSMKILAWEHPDLTVDVCCSKGTYIRSLALDIGNALGVGGHLAGLRRTCAGPFTLERSFNLETLKALVEADGPAALDALLLPMDFAVQDWPRLDLDADTALRLWQGQEVVLPVARPPGKLRVYTQSRFIGIAQCMEDQHLLPLRMMKFSNNQG